MYAVIEAGGKQYRVQEQDMIEVEKLSGAMGETVEFTPLLLGREEEVLVGQPTVSGAKVLCRLLKEGKRKKLTVFTYKAKKNIRRKLGHRQPISRLRVEKIEFPGGKEQDNGA